jgi:hypothetical protein
MQWFLGTYTTRFNRRHKLSGHLFSGRYKSLLVDGSATGYLKAVCDYVHLNPVRAKLLRPEQRLSEYRWSSWPEYEETIPTLGVAAGGSAAGMAAKLRVRNAPIVISDPRYEKLAGGAQSSALSLSGHIPFLRASPRRATTAFRSTLTMRRLLFGLAAPASLPPLQ